MNKWKINDIEFQKVASQQYELAFFSSGYEKRSSYICRKLSNKMARNVCILGFEENSSSDQRKINDNFFMKKFNQSPLLISGDNELPIYNYLSRYVPSSDDCIHILVDYSSMSRLWYTTILNWARLKSRAKTVIIDFVYSQGRYVESEKAMTIKKIIALPGCEGKVFRQNKAVAIFGLGFHGATAFCVLEQLEPDVIYTILASPAASKDYEKKTTQHNSELVAKSKLLRLPLGSVENCYRYLAEIISFFKNSMEITLVPMGPKPHILTAVLLAMNFPEVACLRVSHTNDFLDVIPTGNLFVTRVQIQHHSHY